jgi:hypothetical protein
MQHRGAVAAAGVTAHQRAPGLLVEWIETDRLLGVLDRIPERSIVFEQIDEIRENLPRTLTETFPVRINPLSRTVREDVALIQTCRLMQGGTVSRQTAIGGGFEGHQVNDHAGGSAPRQRARARMDEGIQPGARVSEVVQLAAEVGQCLGITRFRPEGACDPLTRDRSGAGIQNQKGDELLLARAGRAGGDTTLRENTEPSEELDAQGGRNSHVHASLDRRRADGHCHQSNLRSARQPMTTAMSLGFGAGVRSMKYTR